MKTRPIKPGFSNFTVNCDTWNWTFLQEKDFSKKSLVFKKYGKKTFFERKFTISAHNTSRYIF